MARNGRVTDERGVALVEFGLAAPIFFFVLLVAFQIALILIQAYSVRNVTRETARWLAINPDTTDAALRSRVVAARMPMMDPAGFTTVSTAPGCRALSGGRCSGRQPGDPVTVTVQYDLASRLFLSPDFGFGELRVTFPTRLAPYSATAMVE